MTPTDQIIFELELNTRAIVRETLLEQEGERETIERALKISNVAYQLEAVAKMLHARRAMAARS